MTDAEIVLLLAAAIDRRYSSLVLLAGFGGLRLGELLGLRRRDVHLDRSQVRVEVQAVEMKNGERIVTAPKTNAGRHFKERRFDEVRTLADLQAVMSRFLDDRVERRQPAGGGGLLRDERERASAIRPKGCHFCPDCAQATTRT